MSWGVPEESLGRARQEFDNYKFRDGETITRLRDACGSTDNAVLVLHWTGADVLALFTPTFMSAVCRSRIHHLHAVLEGPRVPEG
jgi:hypothetical protein